MHLFLTNDISDTIVRIQGEEHHHLSRVVRLRVGDALYVTHGGGDAVEAVIEEIGQGETRCRVTAMHENFNEPRVPTVLLQAALKNPGKMDWLVEKGTELGMTAFVPLLTVRTIAQSVKTDRLQKLAETATKQCLRGRIPKIHAPISLADAVQAQAGARLLLFHESAALDATPESLLLDGRPLALFIGPEGGFSEEEVALLRGLGADILSLGPRRLRGETAGLAALARINGIMTR
ncbi:MAG: 16S rRNA (uracil(1498)-N(3))-methyltransferase [Bacteroidetes bacterium]|nr:16S rRNA (uracil(1498)-N(3))-methyltransferase [Bacteroidota bacterium]